jgi:hypothetical protein
MLDQLGKHSAAGVHAAFLPLPFAAAKLRLRALSIFMLCTRVHHPVT